MKKPSNSIRGYHYTTAKAFTAMETKGIDGYSTSDFDDFAGIIPNKRMVNLGKASSFTLWTGFSALNMAPMALHFMWFVECGQFVIKIF